MKTWRAGRPPRSGTSEALIEVLLPSGDTVQGQEDVLLGAIEDVKVVGWRVWEASRPSMEERLRAARYPAVVTSI